MSFLQNHPFAVEAYFESSVVLSFALPTADLQPLIPECLSLDTFNGQWAFLAVALVKTRQLRPKGFPRFLGRDFVLIGYRIFTRYTNEAGKRLRGLYIIRSETNSKLMSFFGNIFTHYNYQHTDISIESPGSTRTYHSNKSDFHFTIEPEPPSNALPGESPFDHWEDARRFSGPLPFTFTYDSDKHRVLIIEGVRQHWKPRPVSVLDYEFGWLRSQNLGHARLASAFEIRDVPYYWKKGVIEQWP